MLLTGAVRASGLDVALSAALAPSRVRFATHDQAKVLLDLGVTLALGGDACSDLATVRAEPAVFGQVASDLTASRTLARRAGDADTVLVARRRRGLPPGHRGLDPPPAGLLRRVHAAGAHPGPAQTHTRVMWATALDAHDEVRDGAWVAELTDLGPLPPVPIHRASRQTVICP
ncbi:hypothetical protein HIR71_03405 [Cellulomonas fimi]|uniref:Uncharacterized protein n=1 Tax=Cellulomonas fimi TaxID=1708 RepID=A0A7Y0LWB7_CELFI|nr:hypothetical protein [Cellulomonas fimi]